jgi:hypothetical protein
LSEDEKPEFDDKALTAIKFCLSDDVVRLVANETTMVPLLNKLEALLWRRVH